MSPKRKAMYKTLQEALGLGGVDLDYLRDVVVGKGEPVSGYSTDYRNFAADGVTFSYAVPRGNEAISDLPTPVLGHMSRCFWHFLCDATEKTGNIYGLENRDHVMACPLIKGDLASPALPLRLLHSDVMGLLIPGDELSVQTTFVAAEMRLLPADAPHEPFEMVPASEGEETNDPLLIRLRAPVANIRVGKTPRFVCKMTLNPEVVTPFGALEVSYALGDVEDFEAFQEAFLHDTLILEATGWLLGDCATGRYRKGAQFDLPHHLRLIAASVQTRSRELLMSEILADDAVLIKDGRVEERGALEIAEWFEYNADWMEPEDNPLEVTGDFFYAWKRHESGGALRAIGLEYRKDPNRLLVITAEMGPNNRISVLHLSYEAHESLSFDPSFSEWERSATDSDGRGIMPGTEADARKAWEAIDRARVEKLATMKGDFWLFDEQKDADFNSIGELLTNEEAAAKVLSEALGDGDAGGRVGDLQLLETQGKPGLCMTLGMNNPDEAKKTGQGAVLLDAVLALPGCRVPGKLEVLATREYDGTLAGDIAVRVVRDHAPLTFKVPDLKCHRILPGSEVELELYAVALDFQTESPEPIRIDQGSLYEEFLSDELAKNPGATREDFPYFEINPSDMNALVSENVIGVVGCQASIESVGQADLYGVPLVTFKIPLQRGAHGEAFTQVYTRWDSVKRDVKPGDVFKGALQLLARIRSSSGDP